MIYCYYYYCCCLRLPTPSPHYTICIYVPFCVFLAVHPYRTFSAFESYCLLKPFLSLFIYFCFISGPSAVLCLRLVREHTSCHHRNTLLSVRGAIWNFYNEWFENIIFFCRRNVLKWILIWLTPKCVTDNIYDIKIVQVTKETQYDAGYLCVLGSPR